MIFFVDLIFNENKKKKREKDNKFEITTQLILKIYIEQNKKLSLF